MPPGTIVLEFKANPENTDESSMSQRHAAHSRIDQDTMTLQRTQAYVLALSLCVSFCGIAAQAQESLGDYARKVRESKKSQVRLSEQDARALFASMDTIMEFSEKDSGFQKRAAVKRKLIGRDELEQRMEKASSDRAAEQRLFESELVLKKFGLLPVGFSLKDYLLKDSAKQLGGFYDAEEKTMFLLNWIPIDDQQAIMAHELTHALQDQNHDLMRYLKGGSKDADAAPKMSAGAVDSDEKASAKRAAIEGQATIVFFNYMLREYKANLSETPGAINFVRDQIAAEAPMVVKDAPLLLREGMLFPYKQGMDFELELLKRGGRAMAFQRPFTDPPANTHEVLQPDSYFKHVKPKLQGIPDLSSVLSPAFVAYDSGSIGEFDIEIMAQEFGRKDDVFSVARFWDGGAYVAVKRADVPADATLTTADLALIYVSKWKSRDAAERFAEIYANALPQRVVVQKETPVRRVECETACDKIIWEKRLLTSEGMVRLEVTGRNTVVITQGLDDEMFTKVRPLLVSESRKSVAMGSQDELSMRLFGSPGFVAMAEQARRELLNSVGQSLKTWAASQPETSRAH